MEHMTVVECCAHPQDRRVEITGPTDRKMVINALNRCVFVASVFVTS